MQRLRRGSSLFNSFSAPQLKKKALTSWAAVQDTFFSTKDTFERHRVVFTVGTSIASVATAWAGYSIRHYHETKVDQRLESIETAMKNSYNFEREEIKKIVDRESSSTATCIATAGTTLIIGYALGWRGGRWYANRKFRQEQMKLLGAGHIKPNRWELLRRIKPKGLKLQFLRRPLTKRRTPDAPTKAPENLVEDASAARIVSKSPHPCSQ